jgi:enterochelin esterase-like enzyme
MNHQRILQLVIAVMLVVSFLVGCGGAPVTTPVSEAPTATATPAPPTATPTPTPAPPTNTPTATTAKTESATATVQPAQVSIDSFRFNSQALKGNLLGDPAERPVQVILPPGYATSKRRYPVIYYLHGYGGGSQTQMLDAMQYWFLTGYMGIEGATGNLKADVERGMQLGETQEMILVFPNASNKLGGSFYRSSPTIGDYETYLAKELVDYVDSHYRTLPQRESRGIAGCSMGGYGAAHLGLKYPNVYAVVVAQSGPYFLDREPTFLEVEGFTHEPANYDEFLSLPGDTRAHIAAAAVVAPNANKPPFYLDMPYVIVAGKTEIAPGYIEKVKAFNTAADVEPYLAQPVRLNALLVQHRKNDDDLEPARDLDKLLTQRGIAHEFDDSFINHCSYDQIPPMLKFMSSHLVGEKAGK